MKLSKILLVLSLVMGLVFMAGSAKAATSAIQSLPGGAAVGYFEANSSGLATLVNIQNVNDATAVSCHMTLYDKDSTDVIDFEVPLSPRDNVGLLIEQVDDTLIQITSLGTEHWPIFGVPNGSQTVPLTAIDGRQFGYFTVVINRIDGVVADTANGAGLLSMLDQAAANMDNDPRNDLNLSCLGPLGLPSLVPNFLVVRYALVNSSTQSHADTNAIMLQDFLNLCGITEGDGLTPPVIPGTFWDTIGAAAVSYDWDNDSTWNEAYGTIDDANGANIDAYELYVTRVIDPAGAAAAFAVVADDPNGDNVGDRIYPALGSNNQVYWGRWNVNPALSLTSYIDLVFPASNHPNAGFHQSNRALTLLVFDDNEHSISKSVTFDEVGLKIFGTDIPTPAAALAGDVMITHARLGNLVGETVNDWAGHVNWYPLVREEANVLVTDFVTADIVVAPAIPGMFAGSDVIQIP